MYLSYRFVILLLICAIRFITIVPLEVPVGLTSTTIKVLNIGVTQYNLLWFVSALPSTILSAVGGLLTDKILGLRAGILLFTCTVLLGQVVWSVGTFLNIFWLMLVGRFFIGAGYNPLTIATHGLKTIWFQEFLSTAMSLDAAASSLGDALSFILPQFLYNKFLFIEDPLFRLGTILSIVAIGVLIAVIICIILIIIDLKGKDHPHRKVKESQWISFRDLKNFTPIVWLSISAQATYFAIVYSFLAISQLLFIHQFGLNSTLANIATSLVICAAIFFSPVIGLIIDTTGYYLYWGAFGITLSLLAQVVIILCSGQFFIPFIAATIYSFSILISTASLNPSLIILVETNQVATAFGLLKSIHSLILLVFYLSSGALIDYCGYFILMLLFILLSVFCLLMIGALWLVDFTLEPESIINKSGKELKKIQTERNQLKSCKQESTSEKEKLLKETK